MWLPLFRANRTATESTVSVRHIAPAIAKGIFLGLLVAGLSASQAFAGDDAILATPDAGLLPGNQPKRVDFGLESASHDARQMAEWVVDSSDNRGMPFVIVDKTNARVFVFHADGRLRGAAPALLGLALGDDAVPGIGDRKLSSIRPSERTTPAGRFVAALGRNMHGEEILWVDYVTAISLHRVITTNPAERRAQRLASPTPLDKRISYGCINVPVKFYERVVSPAFTGTNGIVYVLPETRPLHEVFMAYGIGDSGHARPDATGRITIHFTGQ